jgi:hypothetical protein
MTQRASTSSIDHLCLYSSCLSYVSQGPFWSLLFSLCRNPLFVRLSFRPYLLLPRDRVSPWTHTPLTGPLICVCLSLTASLSTRTETPGELEGFRSILMKILLDHEQKSNVVDPGRYMFQRPQRHHVPRFVLIDAFVGAAYVVVCRNRDGPQGDSGVPAPGGVGPEL